MGKRYSIYFDSRKIVIANQVDIRFYGNGLIIKYDEPVELVKLLDFFHSSDFLRNLFIYGDDTDSIFNVLRKHYKVVEAAGGLVRNSKGDFLLIRRNDFWDLPKGKGDKGETSEETALREVEEECGISQLRIEKPLTTTFHIYFEGEKRILKVTDWFAMSYLGNETLVPQIKENITEAIWVERDNINKYLNGTYSSVKDVFKVAGVESA